MPEPHCSVGLLAPLPVGDRRDRNRRLPWTLAPLPFALDSARSGKPRSDLRLRCPWTSSEDPHLPRRPVDRAMAASRAGGERMKTPSVPLALLTRLVLGPTHGPPGRSSARQRRSPQCPAAPPRLCLPEPASWASASPGPAVPAYPAR
ncbi:hypothetical protein ZWY2020_047324 [Hordeum vulgare]|nr:hypothetical protein ZWY2020_047324 [Hordeum vulgare]